MGPLLPFTPIFQLWLLYEALRKLHNRTAPTGATAECLKYVEQMERNGRRAMDMGDFKSAGQFFRSAGELRIECEKTGTVLQGPGLHFLSLLRAPGQVSGWFDSWHAVWTGKQWLGPRKLSSDAASEWHIDALEANSHHTPFANIQLHKWTGSKWQRVA